MSKYKYRCKLTPLGEYFFGGEKTFDWGGNSEKSPYFIRSNLFPSQSTLLGVVRYILLESKNLLDDEYGKSSKKDDQKKYIGPKGFDLSDLDNNAGYGFIEKVGPVYIVNGSDKLVTTPFNHKYGQSEYSPFKMQTGVYSEIGEDTLLPTDFVAKDGIENSFIKLVDGYPIVKTDEIFKKVVYTRVAVKKGNTTDDKDRLFKREYIEMEKGYSFGFEFEIEPKEEEIKINESGIVYMGQERSTFLYEIEKTENKESSITINASAPEGYKVYSLLTDALIKEDIIKHCSFCINDQQEMRTLTYNNGSDKFKNSRNRSKLFTLYKRGSVWYVKDSCKQAFEKALNINALQQIGLNSYVIIGGNE